MNGSPSKDSPAPVTLGANIFVHPNARLGANLKIAPNVFIDDGARIGDAVVIDSGAHIGAGVTVGSKVRIGANVVLVSAHGASASNASGTVIGVGVWIGAGATLVADITVGDDAVIRPGAVVTRSVPPAAIVEGNPAAISGYVDTATGPAGAIQSPSVVSGNTVEATLVRGVTVHGFPLISDLRGNLTVGEFDKQVPFIPKRFFMVFAVPSKEVRGEHAHRRCHQFLICVRGSCAVVADDGEHRVEIALDALTRGVHLPPMTWGVQYKHSTDALLLVFASEPYDASDYIRDYAEFLSLIGRP